MTNKELKSYYRKHRSSARKDCAMIALAALGFFVLMVCVEMMV